MGIKKMVGGGVMIGALAAAGLGMAGSASASPYQYQPKPKVTYSYQTSSKTVTVSNNGQVGNGNTQQTASGAAGAISNPQLALGVNVGAQVPVSVPILSGNAGGSTKGGESEAGTGGQRTSLRQVAGSNSSSNSTSVNTSAENGNNSSVSIGSH